MGAIGKEIIELSSCIKELNQSNDKHIKQLVPAWENHLNVIVMRLACKSASRSGALRESFKGNQGGPKEGGLNIGRQEDSDM